MMLSGGNSHCCHLAEWLMAQPKGKPMHERGQKGEHHNLQVAKHLSSKDVGVIGVLFHQRQLVTPTRRQQPQHTQADAHPDRRTKRQARLHAMQRVHHGQPQHQGEHPKGAAQRGARQAGLGF